jgi:hypothetical protein
MEPVYLRCVKERLIKIWLYEEGQNLENAPQRGVLANGVERSEEQLIDDRDLPIG